MKLRQKYLVELYNDHFKILMPTLRRFPIQKETQITHGIKSLTIPLFILSLAPHRIIFQKKS